MASANNILITGIATTPGPDGSLPLRYELRDLFTQHPDQFNLFILGIRQFQAQSKTDPISYYQLAGIHGEPFKAWNGVQGISNWDFGGYCTHSSVIFAPWHRPYLALFEQSLYKVVQDIAGQFPASLRAKYQAAATDFRLPFFDWAGRLTQGASELPVSLSSPSITVVDVDGSSKSIDNPLYSFSFSAVQPDNGDLTPEWASLPNTVRYPDASGNSQDDLVAQVLTNESASRRENVAMLLLSPSYQDFDAFTNNAWRGPGNPGTYASLEDVHNEIHDETGGPGGHMGSLEVSAFDPLFWVHHCNVDRLWAIWQDLNPDRFVTPQQVTVSNFYTPEGATEDENTQLLPFWDSSGSTFWTPTRVKQTAVFGYAYPETQSWSYSSQDAYQQALRATVTQLYGGSPFLHLAPPPKKTTTVTAAAHKDTGAAATHKDAGAAAPHKEGILASAVSQVKKVASEVTGMAQSSASALASSGHSSLVAEGATTHGSSAAAPVKRGSGIEQPEGQAQHPLHTIDAPKHYKSWVTNMRMLKHGLGQTFRVLVFLGDFNKDPSSWHTEYNVVGRVTMLGRSPKSKCGKCHNDVNSRLMATGTVPLTSALVQDIQAGKLRSLEVHDVVPYLAKNLHWRVTLFNGDEKPSSEVPDLKVSVASVATTVGDDGIPTYGKVYVTHHLATAGKSAGLNEGEEA